jgi:hypothetical protein
VDWAAAGGWVCCRRGGGERSQVGLTGSQHWGVPVACVVLHCCGVQVLHACADQPSSFPVERERQACALLIVMYL